MAWTTGKTWVANTRLYDVDMNAFIRDNLNGTMPALATAESQIFVTTGLNKIAARDISMSTAAASVSATTAGYLQKTGGPNVTVTTGEQALAIWGANITGTTAGCGGEMSCDWDGVSAWNRYALWYGISRPINNAFRGMSAHLFTDLTPGSNTFYSMYRLTVSGGTATFTDRFLIVIAL